MCKFIKITPETFKGLKFNVKIDVNNPEKIEECDCLFCKSDLTPIENRLKITNQMI